MRKLDWIYLFCNFVILFDLISDSILFINSVFKMTMKSIISTLLTNKLCKWFMLFINLTLMIKCHNNSLWPFYGWVWLSKNCYENKQS